MHLADSAAVPLPKRRWNHRTDHRARHARLDRRNEVVLDMNRRERWRKVLETEKQRWSALSCDELVSRLGETNVYELELDSRKYQVEVEVLENTPEYVHAAISVDDGSLPASFLPATDSFIVKRPSSKV